MTKPYIPFIVFLILLILIIPFSFDFATSVVPGWHTAIFSPYTVWVSIVLIALLLGVMGYRLLFKRTGSIIGFYLLLISL